MIKKLSIKNFKSIKELEIDCRRINLFIGEPNTGKSNILEALGVLSACGHGNGHPKEFVRFQSPQNLFYDELLDETVEIKIKNEDEILMEIKFEGDSFCFYLTAPVKTLDELLEIRRTALWTLDYSGEGSRSGCSASRFIKFYRFKRQDNFPRFEELSFLTPPHGSNMFELVKGSKKLRRTMSGLFKDYGLTLSLRVPEIDDTKALHVTYKRTFEVLKQTENVVAIYPYTQVSDTLQRMIFHVIAIESNKDSTLIFEEPETHAFPYYTKWLGEKIAYDETNQYFISTHNPYFLLAILEKAPKDDVNVFVTYFRDYQTRVKCLTDAEVSELMGYDPFANLDFFLGSLDTEKNDDYR